jgi:hypothetical protein
MITVKLYQQLHDRNGAPLVEEVKERNAEGKMQLKKINVFAHVAIANALLAPKQEDPNNPREPEVIALEKVAYYDLAMYILQNEKQGEIELSKDEVRTIINRFAPLYNPLIVGQLLHILNDGIEEGE